MARSGSYDFGLTGDTILKGAVRIAKGMGGTFPKGSKSGQTELKQTREALNMLLKEWQSQGVGLWLNKEIIVFLAYQDGTYSLGPAGDHATLSLIETELSSSSSASDTTLEVDSITDILDTNVIGIELNDNTLHWDVVSGSPSGSTVTIASGLASAANENNNVYVYTTKSQRPLGIKDARLVSDAGAETPMYVCDRQQWYDLPNKLNNGSPSQVFYDRQLDSGILNVWPRPNKVNQYLKLSCRYPIQDIDAAADDPDWPPEVYRAVKFNLAVDISFEYAGIDVQKYATRFAALKQHADDLFQKMELFDTELGSYFFEAEHEN